MDSNIFNQSLSIFVHSASEYLTDCESHGDGLICFSLLNGLTRRNHDIFAYTRYAAISEEYPNLQVKVGGRHRVPFDSLASWEHSWKADNWLQDLSHKYDIDIVWRMHPYGTGCPTLPKTRGKPLVVGPLFYGWPENEAMRAKPRFGIGIEKFVSPLAQKGWHQTLQAASLIICATSKQAESMQNQFPQAKVLCLPVIVDPPIYDFSSIREVPNQSKPFHLLFVANLVANKNPLIFCQAVKLLRDYGINVKATLLGDGSERSNIEAYCASEKLEDCIYLQGKVPNSEVYNYLYSADLLISTSLGEPYGRSIVEAMSVGTPCICHDSGGPAEIIENDVDGLLVKKLTAKAFADAIARTYTNRQTWQYLSKNAISKAKSWRSEVVLARLEDSLIKISQTNKNY
ncbi:glycosyltransferase family 4 protein [Anabaena lutea]|uniref:Glycosyltransferase n=1 Tax=Anabaena lutea FACHB-196 TaxID=2692881 RepID=A0ABR8FJF0_9NOST|nr:glycosyltransferase [Anabaena lutea]MBD2568826.1 glycosyltransferase [Anabaena lutea FACHB-196]